MMCLQDCGKLQVQSLHDKIASGQFRGVARVPATSNSKSQNYVRGSLVLPRLLELATRQNSVMQPIGKLYNTDYRTDSKLDTGLLPGYIGTGFRTFRAKTV